MTMKIYDPHCERYLRRVLPGVELKLRISATVFHRGAFYHALADDPLSATQALVRQIRAKERQKTKEDLKEENDSAIAITRISSAG